MIKSFIYEVETLKVDKILNLNYFIFIILKIKVLFLIILEGY